MSDEPTSAASDVSISAALSAAATQLSSGSRAERDAAETVLLKARLAAVPHLVDALRAPVPAGGTSAVARAALLLSALGAREALPALFDLIEGNRLSSDEKPFVARALAEILDGRDAFDDRACGVLDRIAQDADRYTRAFAAQAYGAVADGRSKARIQALMQDKDAWVREKASSVLRKLAEAEAQSTDGLADFAQTLAATQAAGGPLRPFLDDLGDPRRAVRDAAIAELVRAGKPAVPFLLERLNQPLTRARISAALALARLQDPQAAAPLLIAATAPAHTPEEEELRAVALRALANSLTGMEEGLAGSILPMAQDKDRFVRAAAFLCLGRLADREGLRVITQALAEADPFVSESAAVALSEGVREEDTDLVRPLLLALDRRPEPTAAVKEAILIALSRIQTDDAALRVRVRHRVRREITGVTTSIRKAAVVLLEQLFADNDPPPLTVVDDVLLRLNDAHPEVRVVAASFLRAHLWPGMPGAVPKLRAAVERHEATLALLCIDALVRHDTPEAKTALVSMRGLDEPIGARATAVADAFTPGSSTWAFVPKAPTLAPQPARGESQRPTASVGDGGTVPPQAAAGPQPARPSRVRPAQAAGDAPTVTARFSDDGPKKP